MSIIHVISGRTTVAREYCDTKISSGTTQLEWLEFLIKQGLLNSVLGDTAGMSALLPLNALLNAVVRTDPVTQRTGQEAIQRLTRLNVPTMVLYDREAPFPIDLSDSLTLRLVNSEGSLHSTITATGFAFLYLATLAPTMSAIARKVLHNIECAARVNLAQGLLPVALDVLGGNDSLHCHMSRDEPKAQQRAMLIGGYLKWAGDMLYETDMTDDQTELCANIFGMSAAVLIEGKLYGEAAAALMSASDVNARFTDFLHQQESVAQKKKHPGVFVAKPGDHKELFF